MNSIRELTNRFIDFYNYGIKNDDYKSAAEFCRLTEIKPTMLNEVLKGRSNVGLQIIQNTVYSFEKLNPKWLLTGNGNMLIKDRSSPISNEKNLTDEVVDSLRDQVVVLKENNEYLKKQLNINLEKNQKMMLETIALIKGASRLIVERSAGSQKKLVEERRILDTYVAESLKELLKMDNS